MAFDGMFPAPKLEPTPCGLFSIAEVNNHSLEDDRWIRGFDFGIDSLVTAHITTSTGAATTGAGVISDATGVQLWTSYIPFWVEVESKGSGLGATTARFDTALRQLEAATQKAVEREFWEGFAAQATANNNGYLKKAPTVVTTSGQPAEEALQAIEQSIGAGGLGVAGIIHMTRDVASALGSRLLWKDGKVLTRLGTEVVVGSGYTGAGPSSAASATNKWMYATGPVVVHLGPGEVMNDNLSQGFNSSTNSQIIIANRPAAVYFDPIIYTAAQVTLPAV